MSSAMTRSKMSRHKRLLVGDQSICKQKNNSKACKQKNEQTVLVKPICRFV